MSATRDFFFPVKGNGIEIGFSELRAGVLSQRERNANMLLLNAQTLSKTRRRSETANKGYTKGNGCQRRTEQPLLNSNVAGGRLRFPDQSRGTISQTLGVDSPSRV
ncbi:hypothetical protein V1478_015474 [Vespula squamosa]|uniref:Uncharacterized protein n=1 Tax=Vespula squamosa TaxID=30214 RepID=A0ABD2A5Y4_VESSQ